MEQDWRLVSALMGGTTAMRSAATTYLPMWPNEEQKSYNIRLKSATLFPAYSRTMETLTGKPFSKAIKFEDDVPPQLLEYAEDIDLRGRNLHVFAAGVMETALAYGLAGILVDYPTGKQITVKSDGVRTQADEEMAGLRPYFIEIKPEQILGWKSQMFDGVEKLTQLRLMECVEEEDGEFQTKEVHQVRVLTPGKWQTYRKKRVGLLDDWTLSDEGITTLTEIPFVPFYGNRAGFMVGKPPLIELAHLNVEHWQSASDQQTILHVARVPILTVIGVDDDKTSFTIGASSAVRLPVGGDMKFVEHSGAAIEAGAKDILSLQDRMRQAGAELLIVQPGKMTAFQVGTENELAMCALQRITRDFQDALNEALEIMAEWIGLDEGGHVAIFSDFGASSLAEASAGLLMQAATAGKISDELLFAEFQRRGMIGPNESWDQEKERLDAQGPGLGAIPPMPNVPPEPSKPRLITITKQGNQLTAQEEQA
jgi:hypothetical protein